MRAALVACLLCACGADVDGVVVHFLSERDVPEQADTLEVVVRTAGAGSELERKTYPLSSIEGFPAILELVRGGVTPAQIQIHAYLRHQEDVIAAGSAETEFVGGEQTDVDVALVDLAFVHASSSGTSSGQPSIEVAPPSGVVAGDLLVAVVAHDSGPDFFVPPPAGWSYESSLTANVEYGARVYVFWKAAGAAEPLAYTFTPTPAYTGEMVAGMWSIGGADLASPITLTSVKAYTGSSTSCVAPSITLLGPSLSLYACAKNNAVTTFAPPAGMMEDWDVSSKPNYAMVLEGAREVRLGGPTEDRSAETTAINDGHVGLQLTIAAAP
jgi:hypothetical protein